MPLKPTVVANAVADIRPVVDGIDLKQFVPPQTPQEEVQLAMADGYATVSGTVGGGYYVPPTTPLFQYATQGYLS